MSDLENKIEEQCRLYSTRISEAFKDGVTSDVAKEYWQQGMYSEKEVKLLFQNWLNTKIQEDLMRLSGEIDIFDGITFEDWFEQNKKKQL